ncbi:MAG: DUF4159 domain-containing protein, partial [Chloroherpetonaceae bacterium]
MRVAIFVFAWLMLGEATLWAQKVPPAFRCARLKYSGGGDWYNDPSAVPNLMRFVKEKTGIATPEKEEIVEAASPNIFQYRFVFMTGHGNVRF